MKNNRQFDIAVVGAGPAGLSAARTAARLGFETVVVERLPGPGSGAYPSSGLLTPVPGFVTGRRLFGDLFFPALDLLVPASLIRGFPHLQRFISPSGYEFRATFASNSDFPAALVDRTGLLTMLGDQASSSGAEIRYGVAAQDLLLDADTVVGVNTDEGRVTARVVLAGEGVARHLTQAAGLYTASTPRQYGLLLSQEMEAPAAGPDDLAQIVTFGSRYTSAQHAYGTVSFPAPGRATVFFTILADTPQQYPEQLCWFYLNEYVERDPRVRELLKGGRVLHRSSQPIVLRNSPQQVVRDGFLGMGDAVTPAGHVGILPAVYLGRQAALLAAEAIDDGEVTAEKLAPYEQLLRNTVLPNLESETRLISCLVRLSDDELDHLSQVLNSVAVPTPFFSNWRTLTWEMMGWMAQQLPAIAHDWNLVQSMMAGEDVDRPI